MKIIDKTPLRAEDGSISITDRIQGMLKYGLNWYDRIEAQDKVIPILEKALPQNFILLRNITLGGTEIELPALILIGPAGVFLLNVLHERGVFRAREDEWGTISGGKFVPGRTNHLTRTKRMGQVVQTFLEHAGLTGMVNTEAILMTSDPIAHIESVRPIVRIVMADALERFAVSLGQGRSALSPEMSAAVADILLTGRPLKKPESPKPAAAPAFAEAPQPGSAASSGDLDSLGFDFHEEAESPLEEAPQLAGQKPSARAKSKIAFSPAQWALLIGFALAEFCLIAAVITFAVYSLR
ncbi:MAG: hypothetical protein Fur0035_02070 [Anaerolineales bacterium]